LRRKKEEAEAKIIFNIVDYVRATHDSVDFDYIRVDCGLPCSGACRRALAHSAPLGGEGGLDNNFV
jgi:hypothetical protein